MKRKITFLTAALALLAFLAIPLGMWGQTTVTFTAGTDTGATSVTKDGITVSMSTMSRTDNYRCYADTDMTVTSTVGDITHIELTCTGSGTSNYGPGKFSLTSESSGTYSYSGTTGTWEGTAEEIALHASAQVRMTEIKVTYGGTPALSTYTVTYDCNGGSNCPENETDIQAGSTITLANGPIKDGYEFGGWYDGTDTYDEGDDYTVNGNVTLVAQWIDPTSGNEQWVVTNLADLTENDVFVIVGYNGSYYAMSNNNGTSSAPAPVPVTVTGNEITSTVNENMEWTYSGNATTGYTFYPEGSTSTWLYCSTEAASSNNNNIRVGTGGRKVFELNSSNYLVTKDSYVARYLSIYVNNGTAQDWRGYTTTNNAVAISFYKKVTGGVVPPSITVTNPNEIAYDATSGSFDFAVNDPVDGGQLSVSEEVDWIDEAEINNTTNGYSVTFITTTNQAGTPREGVISLTYAYGDNQTATQNVTITQAGNPNAVMTITEVRTQGTGNVVTKGVVTSITGSNNKTAYIQDASAAIVVYGNFTAAVGDEIRVSGTLQDYNGLLEITSPTVTVISSGNTTNPELMTIAEAVASTNQGWYIRIENATVTAISGSGSSQNTTIAQGQNTIVVRGNLGTSVAVNDVISGLDGNIGYYNTANQIANPQNVTVQENLLPSVTVTPNTINAPAEGKNGALAITYENITEFDGVVFCDANGDELEGTNYPDWIDASIEVENEVYSVAYIISANDGEARTAYFKVLAFDENLDDVLSNIVTVTQAEYVAPSYATLPFTFTGGKADIENTDGLTQEGLGNDYSGGANATTPLKFDHTGDWLLLQFNERPGTLNFDITGNGFSGSTFTVQISENGETYTDLASYTELGTTDTKEFTNLGENVRYIKWIYTNKASGNVGLGAINLYKYGEGPVAEPSVTVTPATISAPAEVSTGTLAIAYENIPDLISFDYYFCDANGNELYDTDPNYPDWIDAAIEVENEVYSVAYTISANEGAARTAYFKVYTTDIPNQEEVYAIVTVSQAEYVAPPTDYAELPFAFNGGRADIENTDGLTQEGLDTDYGTNYPTTKLKFNTTGDWLILHFNEQPGIFKFDIMGTGTSFSGTFTVETSADGVDYETLATYTELGDAETMTFNNLDTDVRYIRWYFTEKVSGCNVGVGDIHLYEYGYVPVPEAFITVNPDEVNVDAEQHDGTLDLAYENLTITDMYDFNIQYYDAQGEEIDEPDWMEALVAEQDPEIGEGFVASYWIMENEDTEARTAYFKVYVGETFSNLVTVNQAAPVIPPTPGSGIYVRVTSLDQLTDGSKVIIAARYDEELTNGYFAMPGETSGKPTGVAFTSETSGNDEILPATITDSEDTYYWTVNVTNDGYTFTNAEGQKIGYSSSTNFATNNNTVWTITRETAAETAMVAEYTGFVIRNGNTNTRAFAFAGEKFGAYSTSNMGGNYNFYLDFFVESMPLPANSIVIEGYENNPNPNGGWYLIASPFAVDPDDVPGMTQGDFDLYSFTDMEEAEWRNYEAEGGHFNLEPGKGYLYAHKTGVTLTFDGEPYTGDGEITLTRNENNTGAYQGWNLVGNPFTETAYIEVDRDFYVMNEAGTNVVLNESNNRTIAPMQGIFVKAEQEGETMKFLTEGTATAGDIDQKIVMNVRKDRNMVIDRAMIRFGEGRQLPKFMFNPNDTKLYIAKDNEEFAVVRSIDENSTPISFRAAEDGTYTLSVNVENVEMEYLHLIDNMTSADIDLLATPSYTFDARTTDYANRFNLVYFTYDDVKENNVQPFAFFNGTEWVINNEGSATLQVIDVTGRMLSSETFNGNARISLDQVPGVYMMRLVSGNDVKVQKVIIK